MPRSHPTEYTPELGKQICDTIASSANGLVQVCTNKKLPAYATILKWLTDADKKEFQQNYQRAREAQADLLIDEMIAIADQPLDEKITTAHITQIKLRIETRQWKAMRLAPNKYGNKPTASANDADEEREGGGNFVMWGGRAIPI